MVTKEYYTYNEILAKARTCKNSVEENQKLGVNEKWGYYFAQSILHPKKDIKRIGSFGKAPKPKGDHISRQIYKEDYIKVCERLVEFVENPKHKRMPNYITWKSKKIRTRTYVYNLSKILVWYAEYKELPAYNTINTKIWIKATETGNVVYDDFVKQTGYKPKTLDDILEYVCENFTYEGYYDDYKSNKQVTASKAGNCVDLLQWLENMVRPLGYESKCIHVECRKSGTGHVFGKFRHSQNTGGNWITRDPAAVCQNSIYNVWCEDGYLLATNPDWFLENLNR